MKFALVLARFDALGGGLERYAADWVDWLSRRGHEVHIVACEGANLPAGTVLHAIGGLAEGPLACARRLEEQAAALKPDIVIDYGDGLGGDVFHPLGGARQAARNGELQSVDPLRRLKRHLLPRWRRRGTAIRAMERLQVRRPGNHIVACSPRVADDLVRFSGAERSKIQLIYNAVDSQRFVPVAPAERRSLRLGLGWPEEGTLFLQVAHNFRLKGVRSTLKAMARLVRQGFDCRLVVAGAGPSLDDYRDLASGLGIAARVNFLGSIDDTRPVFAAADALVHPTFYDACSLVCLEALASGLPVAVSRADGVSALLTEGVQGWLIDDPGDPAEIAYRMKQLLDPDQREAMGAQARVLAEHNEREDAFLRLESLCREVARAKS